MLRNRLAQNAKASFCPLVWDGWRARDRLMEIVGKDEGVNREGTKHRRGGGRRRKRRLEGKQNAIQRGKRKSSKDSKIEEREGRLSWGSKDG